MRTVIAKDNLSNAKVGLEMVVFWARVARRQHRALKDRSKTPLTAGFLRAPNTALQ